MNKNPTFTIFTGTYNSQDIIGRVFKSIKHQTYKNFEWIVIDDCSKDNTVKKVRDFIENNPNISVRHIVHQENTGVNASRKEALYIAKGKYFITWDHDDVQFSNQLEIFHDLWKKYDKPEIGNIFAKMTNQNGRMLGHKFPSEPYISDYINLHNDYLVGNKKKGIVIEHHVCVKIEKLKAVFEYFQKNPSLGLNESFTLGDLWGSLAYLGYATICTNNIVREKYVFEEGRESLSNAPRNTNPLKIYYNKLIWVNYWHPKQKNKSIKWVLRNHLAVAMYGFLAKNNLITILKDTIRLPSKILILIMLTPAFILSKRYE